MGWVVPVEVPGSLPTMGALGSRGVFIVARAHTVARSVHPLGVLLLGLVPGGVRARARLAHLLNGSPLRIRLRLVHAGDCGSGGAPRRRLLTFCGAFGSIGRHAFSNLVVANTPIRGVRFSRMRC